MALAGGVGATLTLTSLALAQNTAAPAAQDYRTLIVQSSTQKAPATVGYNCVPKADGTGGECTPEVKYPLKFANTVTVRPNGDVTVLTKVPATYIRWRAARIDGKGEEVITALGEAKRVTKTGKRWRFTLPKRLNRSTDLLGFDVQHVNAYASFEIGTKIGKTVPDPPKKKTSSK